MDDDIRDPEDLEEKDIDAAAADGDDALLGGDDDLADDDELPEDDDDELEGFGSDEEEV